MPNNPSQDTYNPAGTGSEFEEHYFSELNEGEMLIVPKGVDHKPIAKEEVWLLLFEPNNIKHTGDVISNLTVDKYEKI